MRTPKPSIITATILATSAFVCAVVVHSPVSELAGAVFVGLLVTELDRSGRHIGLRLIRIAALLVPGRLRSDALYEWQDHVLQAGEAGMRPVFVAFSIALRAAPRMAIRYRARARVALYVAGLFGVYLAMGHARRCSIEKRRMSKFAIVRMALAMTVEFPAATYVYVLVGPRAIKVPGVALIALGTASWAALIPCFILGAQASVCLVCLGLLLGSQLSGEMGLRVLSGDVTYANRVLARIAGNRPPDE